MVNKYWLCLLVGCYSFITGADIPASVNQQPRAIFLTIPTLQQKVALYFIKRLINDPSYAELFMELPISEQLKEITLVSSLLSCLIDLSKDQSYSNQNILELSLSASFFESYQDEICELENKLVDETYLEQKQDLLSQKQFLLDQLKTFICVAHNFEKVIKSSSLTYLFVLALNEPTIQDQLSSQHIQAEHFIGTVFDWIVIKNYKYLFEELSTNKAIKQLMIKHLMDLYTQPEFFDHIVNNYEKELGEQDFRNIIYKNLAKLFKKLSYEELTSNNNELSESIIERLVLLTSLDEHTKELLNSIFDVGISAQITVFIAEDKPPISLAAVLFAAYMDNQPEEAKRKQLEQIKYLVEHGLDLSVVQQIASSDALIALAQEQYAQLKKTNPQFITELESAHHEYQRQKERKAKFSQKILEE